MVDIEKLRQAVKDYDFYSRPSNSGSSSPATVGDINKLIDRTVIVLNSFINELEKDN
ncbi:hypothetical protein [uncultured Anaerovibrio sp.]|uniref:hypothetical protein n=1 Tax=uncultured Anaerovibrio sp. TaxID=361586 RepID=UPI0026380E83|nr:hypothetical protein [uncultured Anaerovibrio sp.]